MKQKIHIPCHPEPSLRVAEPFGKLKTGFEKSSTHFQIPKLLNSRILLMLLFPLWGLGGYAQQTQPYEWEWAMSGGSSKGGLSDEAIHDIKVGSDGNYYFIASIFGTGQHNNAQLDGLTVPTNNTPSGPEDIFLFSTDCEGDVRWSQAIGGGSSDRAYNLVLDSEDNVYIGGYFSPGVTNSAGTFPVRFSATDSLPTNSNDPDYHKKIFLVKYDKDGNYQGKKALQGNVDSSNSGAQILDLAISNDTLHFIVGLQQGTHLDNQVTVPSTVTTQYHLAKYDTDLNYVSSMVLPVADGTAFPTGTSRFVYDESNNTYYITGERRGSPLMSLTYDGQSIVNRSFIIAFKGNDGSKKWIREINSMRPSGYLNANLILSLSLDNNSNVYVGGSFHHHNLPNIEIYDPADTSVTPYFFTPAVTSTIPMIIKFDSNDDVQWVESITGFNQTAGTPGPIYAHGGIVINGNEVALGTQGSNLFWGNIEVPRPFSHQPDPLLVRFDKQTGNVIDVHDIEGSASENERMTALAVDNDGNYIAGGSFVANLFMNNTLGINPLISTGEADFFVAKLANSECGSGLSTENFNSLSFNVYPNPTTGIINVETTEQLSAYTIYDATGRLVRQSMFDSSNQINLENTSNGVYFIRIVTVEGNAGTVKVVKR